MKKYLKMLLLVFFLLVIFCYTLAIGKIPDKIVLFEGENISMNTLLGLEIKDTVETSSNNEEKINDEIENKKLEVSLFDIFKIKDVDVDVIPKTKVIPVGNIAGVKLYTNGVLVVRNVRNRRKG